MTASPGRARVSDVVVEIGGLPIQLRCGDPAFVQQIGERYAGYVTSSSKPSFHFDIELAPRGALSGDEDVRVTWDSGRWLMQRGDFRAEWYPAAAHGTIHQTINPFSLDSVLRIVHTLLLAGKGGFLLHASSAIRNGRAFLFSGVSGAGKTTMARLAPPDAALLTDEISYVTRQGSGYFAVGTPFYGELARAGENLRAPSRLCTYSPKARKIRSSRWPAPRPSAGCWETSCFSREIPNSCAWSSTRQWISPDACRCAA